MAEPPLRAWAKYSLFFGAGLLLLYLAFRNQPLADIAKALKEANYFWACMVLLVSTVSHIVRALRWRAMVASTGHSVTLAEAFFSLMAGYLASIAIPRLGEISRCAALSKTSKAPFPALFGTVITERITDISCLLAVITLAFLLEASHLSQFYAQEISPSLVDALSKKSMTFRAIGIITVLSGTLTLAYLLLQWKQLKRKRWFLASLRLLKSTWTGISSIGRMESPWLFAGYTAIIWMCYYLMTYLWFFSFPETQHLGVGAGLAMMAVGSVARSLPIQGGGMGAYHYLFAQAMMLYGVGSVHGAALAVLVHGAQMLYTLLVGGFAFAWLGAKESRV